MQEKWEKVLNVGAEFRPDYILNTAHANGRRHDLWSLRARSRPSQVKVFFKSWLYPSEHEKAFT